MAVLKNRVGVLTGTTGIGVITLGAAIGAGVAPFPAKWQTFTQGGVVNGDSVRYLILDNAEWEYGPGIWTSASNTLARAAGAMDGSVAGQKSSTNALLALSGSAQVFLTAVAEDLTAFAQLVSPAFTGNPTAPTAAPGDNDTSIATTAFTQSAIDAKAVRYDAAQGLSAAAQRQAQINIGAAPVGQCYLMKSGVNLILMPMDGNLLWINGALEVVTSPTLSPTSPVAVAANTFYYIYAFMNASVMTLEFSVSTYATNAVGVRTKSGDPTRTLVGIASSAGAGVWSTNVLELASYFNPKDKTVPVAAQISPNTTNTTLIEMASAFRTPFVTFNDREVLFKIYGRVTGSIATASLQVDIGVDSVVNLMQALTGGPAETRSATAAGDWNWIHAEVSNIFAEVRHFATGMFACSTGNINFIGGWSVNIQG